MFSPCNKEVNFKRVSVPEIFGQKVSSFLLTSDSFTLIIRPGDKTKQLKMHVV